MLPHTIHRLRSSLRLTVLILTGLIFAPSLLFSLTEYPPRVASWARPPGVVVCSSATVTREQVRAAMDWWGKLGHQFGPLRYKAEATNPQVKALCDTNKPMGYIVLSYTDETIVTDTELAATVFHHDSDRDGMHWARVYLHGPVEERMLEHEMGHALGYLHWKDRGHIMHPRLSRSGWEAWGLREVESLMAEAAWRANPSDN